MWELLVVRLAINSCDDWTRCRLGNEISTAYDGHSKMEVLFGAEIWKELTNKTVIDFGCEDGVETIDMARPWSRKVIGLDIREDALGRARAAAQEAGMDDRCTFTTEVKEKADVVVSLDAFVALCRSGCDASRHAWSPERRWLCPYLFRTNLVSPVRRSRVFDFSLGASCFLANQSNALAPREVRKQRYTILKKLRWVKPANLESFRKANC
jgi:hypothetical protein